MVLLFPIIIRLFIRGDMNYNPKSIERAIDTLCKIAGADVEGKIITYFQNGQYANDVYQNFMNAGHMPPAPGNVKAEFSHEATPNGGVKLTVAKITATEPKLQQWAQNAFKAFGGAAKLQQKLCTIAKDAGADGLFTLRSPTIVETPFEF